MMILLHSDLITNFCFPHRDLTKIISFFQNKFRKAAQSLLNLYKCEMIRQIYINKTFHKTIHGSKPG